MRIVNCILSWIIFLECMMIIYLWTDIVFIFLGGALVLGILYTIIEDNFDI